MTHANAAQRAEPTATAAALQGESLHQSPATDQQAAGPAEDPRTPEIGDLLRFATAGSVDDGKSTLIGRLLYDSKSLYQDQVDRLEAGAKPGQEPDFALLTDGLRGEREQGITIDVAHRYFETARRKFIIADSPGHEQYTRNMATAASTADLAIILVDARQGLRIQSKRHAFIASLMQIPHLVVAINKMDLVDHDPQVFESIRREFSAFAAKLEVHDVHFIPISALKGDNVARRSTAMPWYQGPTLLGLLESIHIASDRNLIDLRFPVQYVIRPNQDFRGYAGTILSGVLRKGDQINLYPSGRNTRIASIQSFDGPLSEAFAPMAITVTLEDELDISRGDMLVHRENRPQTGQELEAMLVWFDEEPLDPKATYLLRHTTRLTRTRIERLHYKVDVETLSGTPTDRLQMNEIGRVAFRTLQPLHYDSYQRNRATGSLVLIDERSNRTVAAGMIVERAHRGKGQQDQQPHQPLRLLADSAYSVRANGIGGRSSREQPDEGPIWTSRERARGHRGELLWLGGSARALLPQLAQQLERELAERGGAPVLLDLEALLHAHPSPQPLASQDQFPALLLQTLSALRAAGLLVLALLPPNSAGQADALPPAQLGGAVVSLHRDGSLLFRAPDGHLTRNQPGPAPRHVPGALLRLLESVAVLLPPSAL